MSQTDTASDVASPEKPLPFGREPRIGVLVVAYNAASTLAKTLDRIPDEFRSQISEVFVCDDASPDRTYLVGLGYQQTQRDLPVSVIRHENEPRLRRQPEGRLPAAIGARPRHHRAAARATASTPRSSSRRWSSHWCAARPTRSSAPA